MYSCAMERNGLASFVKRQRERLGLSQERLSEKIDMSSGYISSLETNKINTPEHPTRRRLAEELGVSEIDLLIAAGELEPEDRDAASKILEIATLPADEQVLDGFLGLSPQLQEAILALAHVRLSADLKQLGGLLEQLRRGRQR